MRRGSGQSVRAQGYAVIRERIVALDYKPGRQLSENELGAELGVSRTPVREALIRLADEGLVEVVPQLGTFVSLINVQQIRDQQFVREAVERAALSIRGDRLRPDELDALRSYVARQRDTEPAADYEGFFALDESFHRMLVGISGYSGAWPAARRAWAHLNRVRRLSLMMPTVLKRLIAEHETLVAALSLPDLQEADRILTRHLRAVLELLPALREQYPGYFLDDEAGSAEPAIGVTTAAGTDGWRGFRGGWQMRTPI
ncbi:GntR family transcriptional regulator [Candidatus Dormibacter sp.]|uniref:GntR family transcriptional regulator n=1 Tax=Candidatus Dormibacter sp. TaxID=2973982 RepID=UPI003D9BA43D